jgi:SAM-dependent methyltransferase
MKVSGIIDMYKNRRRREELYCTADYWDSKAAQHQGDAVSMWPNNHLNPFYQREQLAWIDRILPDVRGLSVLDIGCGTGRNSRYLASRGARVLGIDFSGRAVEIARRKADGLNPAYRVQSIFDLSDDCAFDVAISWGTVAIACRSRGELRSVMDRISASLKPGGKLLLCEPVHRGFLHRVLDMDKKQFIEVMTEAGFTIRETVDLHFWPMRLALAYVTWPRLITSTGYYFGQGVMALFGRKVLGDYKAIYAIKGQPGK